MMEKLREECGIFGVVSRAGEAAGITYNALLALQHRGQEGAGIALLKDSSILCHKDVGLVSEVFSPSVLRTSRCIGSHWTCPLFDDGE